MSDWSEEIGFILRKLGKTAGAAARLVKSSLDDDPNEILCYRGYGNSSSAWIHGRVIERREFGPSTDGDSTLRNLLNTYRRADSDPLPFADVKVIYGDATETMKADDEGFFGGWVRARPESDSLSEYSVELMPSTAEGEPIARGTGQIVVPSESARFGIISDIDDTVIQSRVSSFIQAARTVMLGNARTRLPFPGVAAFYRALRDGATREENNPVFYVSSSPWNIYDVISEFMDLQNIPSGPILLRDWDIAPGALSATRHFEHKGVAIRNILSLYPELSFILIGDSSQHDPEIYRQIVAEFRGRIPAIYIRDVINSPARSSSMKKLADEVLAAGSILVISPDTLGAARHAAEKGWINRDFLPDIADEKKADEGTAGAKVSAPDGGQPGPEIPAKIIGDA